MTERDSPVAIESESSGPKLRPEARLRDTHRTLLVGGAQATGLVARYVSFVVAATTLGVGDFGRLAVVLALGNLISVPVGLGLKSSAIAFLPKFEADGDYAMRGRYIRSTFLMVLRAALSAMLLGVVASLVLYALEFDDWTTPVLAASYGGALALMNLGVESARADDQPLMGILLSTLLAPCVTLMLLSLAGELSVPTVGLIFVLGPLVSASLQFRVLRPAAGTANTKSRQEWRRHGLPLAFSGAAQLLISQVPVLVLGWFVSSEAAGGFSAASRVAALVTLLVGAVAASLTPRTAVLLRSHNYSAATDRYKRLLLASWIATVPLALVLFVGQRRLLEAFGTDFGSYVTAGRILIVGFALGALVGPVAVMLIAIDRRRDVVMSYTVIACLVMVAAPIAAAMTGAVGVAVAVAVGMALQNIWQGIRLVQNWPREATRIGVSNA